MLDRRIVSIAKAVRVSCAFTGTFRFKNTACDVEVGGRHSSPILVTELHVNRGGDIGKRVLSFKCDECSAGLDDTMKLLGLPFLCSLHILGKTQNIVNMTVFSWFKEVRLGVECDEGRIDTPYQGDLILGDTRYGPVAAYEPLVSGNRREMLLTDSSGKLDKQVFDCLKLGVNCRFEPYLSEGQRQAT